MSEMKLMTFNEMCFAGSILIVVIILIRLLFIKHMPKIMFKTLWIIAILRFLLPISVSSVFSIYTYFGHMNHAASQVTSTAVTIADAYDNIIYQNDPSVVAQSASIGFTLIMIWLAGMIVSVGYFTIDYFKCRKEFNMSLPIDDIRIREILNDIKISKCVQIRVLDTIKSPVVYGMIRPIIILPKFYTHLNDEQLRHILFHEVTHIKHFDGIYKFFTAVTACVYWFNPLVWVMFIVANRDIELSCDESVLNKIGLDFGRSYAMTLLSMEERKKFDPLRSYFSRYATKERIDSIIKMNKKTMLGGMIATIIVASFVLGFTTSAIHNDYAGDHDENIENSTENTVMTFDTTNHDISDTIYVASLEALWSIMSQKLGQDVTTLDFEFDSGTKKLREMFPYSSDEVFIVTVKEESDCIIFSFVYDNKSYGIGCAYPNGGE